MNQKQTEFDIVEKHFASIYLTVIALIQGIALSVLSTNFLSDLHSQPPLLIERYTLVALTIFITWHHYMYGVIYLRWFPGILDTLLPLSIGASQFVAAGSIQDNDPYYWLIFLSLFFLFAGFAYFNAAKRTKIELFLSSFTAEMSAQYCRYIWRCHIFAGIFCFAHFVFISIIATKMLPYNMIHASIIMSIIYIASYEIYYLKYIKPHYLLMLREPT